MPGFRPPDSSKDIPLNTLLWRITKFVSCAALGAACTFFWEDMYGFAVNHTAATLGLISFFGVDFLVIGVLILVRKYLKKKPKS